MDSKCKMAILALSILLPTYAAADNSGYTSKLSNQTNNATDKFYLVKEKVWGMPGCVVNQGSQKINPGESTVLTIKKGCKWGGVSYTIFKVSDHKKMGKLVHSFRDNVFRIEINSACGKEGCIFYDMSPMQMRSK